MESTGDTEMLALQIYGRHRAAIERINRALSSKVKIAEWTMRGVVEEELENSSNELLECYGYNNRVRSFRAPHLDIFGDKGHRSVLSSQARTGYELVFVGWVGRKGG